MESYFLINVWTENTFNHYSSILTYRNDEKYTDESHNITLDAYMYSLQLRWVQQGLSCLQLLFSSFMQWEILFSISWTRISCKYPEINELQHLGQHFLSESSDEWNISKFSSVATHGNFQAPERLRIFFFSFHCMIWKN